MTTAEQIFLDNVARCLRAVVCEDVESRRRLLVQANRLILAGHEEEERERLAVKWADEELAVVAA